VPQIGLQAGFVADLEVGQDSERVDQSLLDQIIGVVQAAMVARQSSTDSAFQSRQIAPQQVVECMPIARLRPRPQRQGVACRVVSRAGLGAIRRFHGPTILAKL
jgi:hypothetical protein